MAVVVGEMGPLKGDEDYGPAHSPGPAFIFIHL